MSRKLESLANTFDSEFKRQSLYVYLEERGCPLEFLQHIRDFYEKRRIAHPVYNYPNKEDNETVFCFGKFKGKSINDPAIPKSYINWCLKQEKLGLTFPIFYNSLRKFVAKYNIIESSDDE